MKNSALINQRPKDIAEMNKFQEENKKNKLSNTTQQTDGDVTMMTNQNSLTGIPKVNNNDKIFKDKEGLGEDLKSRFDAGTDRDTYINILNKKTDMTKVKEKYKEEV